MYVCVSCSVISNSLVTHGLMRPHEIFQTRILEWVAISYSRKSSWPKDWTCISCISRQVLYHCITWTIQHVVSVQFSRVRLFATPWIAAHQASLSITSSWSLLKTHVHWVRDAIQPSHPLSSPSPPAPNPSQHQYFPMSQHFTWGGQSTGVSALASFLPKKSRG